MKHHANPKKENTKCEEGMPQIELQTKANVIDRRKGTHPIADPQQEINALVKAPPELVKRG